VSSIAARSIVADTATRASVRAQALAMTAVCWGALAFGAVYSWAYWPLAAICLAAGSMAIAATRELRGSPVSRWLGAGLIGVGAAMALQVVPLPFGWLEAISPRALSIIANTDFAFGAGVTRYHALSLDPAATAVAFALYAAFAVLFVGMTRLIGSEEARHLVEALTIFAAVLALIGIVQKPIYSGKVLGFWTPQSGGEPFGPFVNKNHFAGWMLMALPLTLALLCAGLERGMRGLRPGWRYRVLWLSSPEASRLILLGTAALMMALSLMLTMSRSGISALAMSLLFTTVIMARGVKERSRRTAGTLYLLALGVTTVAWVGADTLIARFSDTNWSEFNNRLGAWTDALGVASAFPLVGTGVNTYATAARFYQRHDLNHFYAQSHNDYLELLAGGGVLLAVPVVVCVVALAIGIRRRMKEDPPSTSWWLRRGAITALCAMALQETVEFSLQMPGNVVLFALVCALALHKPRDARPHADTTPAPERPRLRVVASNALAGSR
jgi:O-antigen ligase